MPAQTSPRERRRRAADSAVMHPTGRKILEPGQDRHLAPVGRRSRRGGVTAHLNYSTVTQGRPGVQGPAPDAD
jgi:hypothetical protein